MTRLNFGLDQFGTLIVIEKIINLRKTEFSTRLCYSYTSLVTFLWTNLLSMIMDFILNGSKKKLALTSILILLEYSEKLYILITSYFGEKKTTLLVEFVGLECFSYFSTYDIIVDTAICS